MLGPPDPPLGDGIVTLRPFRTADIPDIVAACRDPEIPRWTRVPDDYTEADAQAFLAMAAEGREAGTAIVLAVCDAVSGGLLGATGIHGIGEGTGEIGYWIRREARGRGIAPRSVRLVSRWALTQVGLARLELLAEPANPASQRVAEKAGFTREGVLRSYREIKGTRRDFVMFSLLPGDLD
jgi:RimJ/RimL family protein N-acetyltransferase